MGAPARTKMLPDVSTYLLHYGQTDGEAPERGWANANPLANSTKEMGPGSRRDALDDHFDDWNRLKGNRAERRRRELVERKRHVAPMDALRHAELRNQNPAHEPTVTSADYVQAILEEASMNQEERLRVARTIYQYNCQRVRITASGHGLGMERARFRLMFNRVKCSADRYMAHLQEFIRDREQLAQRRRDRQADRRVIQVLQRQYLWEQRSNVRRQVLGEEATSLLSSLMSYEMQAAAPPEYIAADDVYACCALPFFPGRGFKSHDQHSAHAKRYYYVIESGAYSSLTACVTALSLAPEPAPPVRVSTAEQAGHAWWSICREHHPHCQARHAVAVTQPLQKAIAHTRRAPSLRMVGFSAVFKPHPPTRPQARASPNSTSSSFRLSDSESGTGSSSRRSGTVTTVTSSTGSSLDATPAPIAPFLFVVVKTGAIYFDAQEAHAESRRIGAKKFNPTNNDSISPPWNPLPHPASILLDGSSNISTQKDADQWQIFSEALDDVRSGAPHGEIVQGWLDIQRCPAGWTHRRVALFQRVARRAALKKLRPSKTVISLGRSDAERLTWMDALKKRVEARVERKKRVAAICERRERGLARLSRVSHQLLPTHSDSNAVLSSAAAAAEARLAREQEADAEARRERVEYVETLRRAGLAKQQAAKSTRGVTGKSAP
ncbi:hypothetical protein C8R43DRAFT_964421 [Mycena crocata]|nr:hypothetical protein C8R43DRAFT_964421 [Mycena crocata]